MHPADIQARLKKAGVTQSQIAEELGVCDSTVAHVIYGRATSRRVADRIALYTGLPLSKLWPGRYEPKKRR